uniref:(northern house mosquito) hypothetical protein n=1 Tax=Culex pipiens TaxID=7175 RepID=A0A8D8JXS0_CULPI
MSVVSGSRLTSSIGAGAAGSSIALWAKSSNVSPVTCIDSSGFLNGTGPPRDDVSLLPPAAPACPPSPSPPLADIIASTSFPPQTAIPVQTLSKHQPDCRSHRLATEPRTKFHDTGFFLWSN